MPQRRASEISLLEVYYQAVQLQQDGICGGT